MSFEERFQWSIEMQELHAIPLYESYFNVEAIIEVDKAGSAEEDTETEDDETEDSDQPFKMMDISGLDKIIMVEPGYPVHVAQRFRRPYHDDEEGWTEPDFSLRLKSYGEGASEYHKLRAAYQGYGNVPALYGFGRAPYGRQVAKAQGFDEFYLIDLHRFLSQHLHGGLNALERAPNGDGSMGLYFDLDELWSRDCIIKAWGAIAPDADAERITAYTDGGESR